MARQIRIVMFGVGPIGVSIAKLVLQKEGLTIVGAVDVDPSKVGRDLGEVMGTKPLGVKVSGDAKKVLAKTKPDVVLHATTSSLKAAAPQIEIIVKAGADVVSTCEELSYPKAQHPDLAQKLNSISKRYGATVLGTGVNPGFLMDTLVIVLTGVCQTVNRIKVVRLMDASKRRLPFQKKIGAGLTVDEFKAKVAAGGFGHVGLTESATMIADAVGWKLDKLRQSLEPVITQTAYQTEFLKVEPNHVAGIRQVIEGIEGGEVKITLDFQAYVGAQNPSDKILIDGVPPIDLTIRDGVHGDFATAAIVVNSIPKVIAHAPGLVTMKDLSIPSVVLSKVQAAS